ncbi:unnamed protein product [Caenorhabditis nigoni]
MLPKTKLVQYLAAYQQQLLARSGIILLPPNSCKVHVLEQLGNQSIPSPRPMRYVFGWRFLYNMAIGGIAMSVKKCPIDGFRFYMKKFEGSQKDAQEYWRALTWKDMKD